MNYDGLSPLSLAARHSLWDMFRHVFEVCFFTHDTTAMQILAAMSIGW